MASLEPKVNQTSLIKESSVLARRLSVKKGDLNVSFQKFLDGSLKLDTSFYHTPGTPPILTDSSLPSEAEATFKEVTSKKNSVKLRINEYHLNKPTWKRL